MWMPVRKTPWDLCVFLLCMCVLWDHISEFAKSVPSVDAYVETQCVLCVRVCVCVCLCEAHCVCL